MEVSLITLCENTAGRTDVLAEWGLSILVEVDGLKLLLDTGYGISTVHNAVTLDVNLKEVQKIVLSHGHADHTGGLREVLRRTGRIEIIAHPDIWASKYVSRPGEEHHTYIGIPFQPEELERLGAFSSLSEHPVWITDDIVTTGEIPMVVPYETIDSNLYVKDGDNLVPDPLADDQALVIKANFGLVVVLGCAHRGLINTLKYAREITGVDDVYAIIGGTHLFRADEERIERTIADLKEIGVQKLGVSHCTSFFASARLAQEFADSFFLNNAGTRLTLP